RRLADWSTGPPPAPCPHRLRLLGRLSRLLTSRLFYASQGSASTPGQSLWSALAPKPQLVRRVQESEANPDSGASPCKSTGSKRNATASRSQPLRPPSRGRST